jgi:sterol desaturase/sphingolipid hydroxylase (fatty acid hydroxylase superfamily)
MQAITEYFNNMPSLHRALLITLGLTLFWLAEGAAPNIKFTYNKWRHAAINLFFTATTVAVNFALAFLLLWACNYTYTQQIGLFYWLGSAPFWLKSLLCLLMLDFFGAYLIHFIQHKIKVLWRFHVVHHTDVFLDTTSANRHHPGESLFRALFTTLGILICGAPFWIVMLYQSLSVVFTQFNHGNFKLPLAFDKLVSYVLVTPGMHRVHHHNQQPYTDANYGNIFALWDRLFGTYKYLGPQQIVFGVNTHMDAQHHNTIGALLKLPFTNFKK